MDERTVTYQWRAQPVDGDGPGGLTGLAVPYGTRTSIGDGVTEEFAADAFDPVQVVGLPLLYGHDARSMPVGVIRAARNTPAGLEVDADYLDTDRGREARTVVAAGAVTGLSVGFQPITNVWDRARSHVTRTAARLRELSLVVAPAYDTAGVMAVREETRMTDTTDTTTPVVDTEARDAIAEVRTSLLTLTDRLDSPPPPETHPLAQYRGLEDYYAAAYNGDAPDNLLHRTIVDQVTGDNPGLLPPSWSQRIREIFGFGRPAITAFGIESAGESGMDFNWPTYAGGYTGVGKQATQKTDVTSVKVSFGKGTASLDTYAGGSDIAYQLLYRSSPSYREAYLRVLSVAYGVATDTAFGAALVAAGTPQIGYDLAADTDGAKFAADLFKASVAVESATGAPAGFALVASDVFVKLGAMTKLVAPKYGTQNVPGVAQANTLTVDVNGLPVIHDRNLAAGTILVSNTLAASWIEDGPRVATVENPLKLGHDVAIWGMGTTAAYIPGGIIKISKT